MIDAKQLSSGERQCDYATDDEVREWFFNFARRVILEIRDEYEERHGTR